jgi:hypothetical protein
LCQSCTDKREKKLIKKMAEDFANELDFYDYPKTIAKCKKEEGGK